jgi:Zn-dependent protease with chaperone function
MEKRAFIDKISVPVTASTHPHIYRRIEGFAQELGIPMPEVRVVVGEKARSSLLGQSLAFRAQAMRMGDDKVIAIGNRVLRHFGTRDGTLSEGLAGVLAHEMAHVKYDLDYGSLAQWRGRMPVLGTAVGLAAMGMYQYYASSVERQKELEEDLQKGPRESRGDVTAGMGMTHAVVVAAQYAVAGVLGLAAGTWARRASSHFIEFRADRISAELLGDGKPLAEVLKGLREEPFRNAQKKTFVKLIQDGVVSKDQFTAFRQQNNAKGRWTHPDIGERIRRLEAWTPPADLGR